MKNKGTYSDFNNMKKKILTSVLIALSFLFWQNAGFSYVIIEDDPDLENAIIIEGLDMPDDTGDAGEPLKTEKFSSSEKKTVFAGKTGTKPAAAAAKKTASSADELICSLKKQDKRWHITEYRICKGDNLWRIASKFDTDHRLIIKASGIKKPSSLKTGKIIKVPNRNGVFYTVRKGDTLYGIAAKFKTSSASIEKNNSIKKKNVRTGQKLFIPDAAEPAVKSEGKAVASARAVKKKSAESAGEKSSAVKSSSLCFSWPVKGIRISSGFGTRKNPFNGKNAFHSGIDISCNEGTRIRAAEKGKVIFSGWKSGYGNTVIIRHEKGYITVYAHNSRLSVQEGSNVERGQVVSLSGRTGAVTGAHLHFEVRKYLTPLDPMRFLK